MRKNLSLDTIISAVTMHLRKWSPQLKSNQAADLLRYLIYRLYERGEGNLIGVHIQLAQLTLGNKLDLSRQWVHVLCGKLRDSGWIDYSAPRLSNGRRDSCIFSVGPLFVKLIISLQKSKRKNFSIKKTHRDSVIEEKFLESAKGRISGLRAQYVIGDYRIDFAVPHIKLAIELDGHEFHSSIAQRAYDMKRTRFLQEQGWTVVRFSGSEVNFSSTECVDEVLRIINNQQYSSSPVEDFSS